MPSDTFKTENPSYVPIGIAKKAVKTFGEENQIKMLFEEMAELQDAILKFDRGRDTIEHVQEEIADVRIMLAQMCVIFGKMGVYEQTKKKLERLEKRINEHNQPKETFNPENAKQGEIDFEHVV